MLDLDLMISNCKRARIIDFILTLVYVALIVTLAVLGQGMWVILPALAAGNSINAFTWRKYELSTLNLIKAQRGVISSQGAVMEQLLIHLEPKQQQQQLPKGRFDIV